MTFFRITCAKAKKLFFSGKPFHICPVKLRPGKPWNPECLILSGAEYMDNAIRYKNNPVLWKGSVEKTAWNMFINQWSFYNTSYEQGYYPAYYVEKE
jgi:hypothetical protein